MIDGRFGYILFYYKIILVSGKENYGCKERKKWGNKVGKMFILWWIKYWEKKIIEYI